MTRKTHCKRGHELTEQNSRWRVVGTYHLRGCRVCSKLAARLRYRGETLRQPAAVKCVSARRTMSDAERDECIALYLTGTTLDRLVEIFDRERNTIVRLVRRRGVQRGDQFRHLWRQSQLTNCSEVVR